MEFLSSGKYIYDDDITQKARPVLADTSKHPRQDFKLSYGMPSLKWQAFPFKCFPQINCLRHTSKHGSSSNAGTRHREYFRLTILFVHPLRALLVRSNRKRSLATRYLTYFASARFKRSRSRHCVFPRKSPDEDNKKSGTARFQPLQ